MNKKFSKRESWTEEESLEWLDKQDKLIQNYLMVVPTSILVTTIEKLANAPADLGVLMYVMSGNYTAGTAQMAVLYVLSKEILRRQYEGETTTNN